MADIPKQMGLNVDTGNFYHYEVVNVNLESVFRRSPKTCGPLSCFLHFL